MERLDSQDLTIVKDRIKLSESFVDDKFVKAHNPAQMRRWYKGDHYSGESPLSQVAKQDQIVANYTLINILTKKAAVAFGDPSFRITPAGEQFADQTRLLRHILEATWREIGATRPCSRAFVESRVVGFSIVATGWRFETATMVYDDSDPREGMDEEELLASPPLVWDNPYVRRVKPEWWLPDPDAPEDWRDGWYVGEKWRRPLIQMQRHPRYAHVRDKLKGNTVTDYLEDLRNVTTSDELSSSADKHLRMVEGYTTYHRDYGLVVEWTKEISDEPLWVGGRPGFDYPADWQGRPYYPFVMMENIPLVGDESPFTLGDVEVTETQQMAVDLSRSQLAAARRMNNVLYLIDASLAEEAKEAIQKGDMNALVEINAQAEKKLGEYVEVMARGQIQPEVFADIDKSGADFSELSRVAAFRRGMRVPGVEFATEAQLMAAGSSALAADEKMQYQRFVAQVAQQITHLLNRWGDRPRELQLPREGEAESKWVTWTGGEIQGDFEYVVEPGSMDPPDDAQEEQKWYARLTALAPLAQFGLNPLPLAEQWLKTFDFPGIEKVMTPMISLQAVQQLMQTLGVPPEAVQEAIQMLMQGGGNGQAPGGPPAQSPEPTPATAPTPGGP